MALEKRIQRRPAEEISSFQGPILHIRRQVRLDCSTSALRFVVVSERIRIRRLPGLLEATHVSFHSILQKLVRNSLTTIWPCLAGRLFCWWTAVVGIS